MSMLGTLGKIAVGVMVARTVGKAMSGGGSLLGGLLGGKKESAPSQGTPSSGGLGDLGNLGGLINSFGKGDQGGIGDVLGNLLQGKDVKASPSEEEKAKVLLYAMLNAAKSDGQIDANEQKTLLEHIGDATPEEIEIVKEAMNSPLDVEAFIKSVPEGMEEQVYLMSLMAIELDDQKEAQYLDALGRGLGISRDQANLIHQKVGAPVLYS